MTKRTPASWPQLKDRSGATPATERQAAAGAAQFDSWTKTDGNAAISIADPALGNISVVISITPDGLEGLVENLQRTLKKIRTRGAV